MIGIQELDSEMHLVVLLFYFPLSNINAIFWGMELSSLETARRVSAKTNGHD